MSLTGRRRWLAYGVGALVAALVVAQLIGPPLAEKRVRAILDDNGEVSTVSVSSFPAIKLLAQRADEVRAHFTTLRLGTGDIGEQLEESRKADKVRVTIDDGVLGPLQLRDLEYRKDGDAVSGSASVSEQALLGLNVTPVPSDDGKLHVRGELFGVSAEAVLSANDEGALEVAPAGIGGAFVSFTVFEDPAVDVTDVSAQQTGGGFTIRAEGRLP